MPSQKILVAVDFSSVSAGALEFATRLTKNNGGKLLVAHVDERLPAYRMGPGYSGVVEPGLNDLVKRLVAVTPTEPGVEAEHRLLLGDPVRELVQLIVDEGVDLAVLGSHAHNPVQKWILGSVAEGVLRSAPCAVILYRPPRLAPMHAADE